MNVKQPAGAFEHAETSIVPDGSSSQVFDDRPLCHSPAPSDASSDAPLSQPQSATHGAQPRKPQANASPGKSAAVSGPTTSRINHLRRSSPRIHGRDAKPMNAPRAQQLKRTKQPATPTYHLYDVKAAPEPRDSGYASRQQTMQLSAPLKEGTPVPPATTARQPPPVNSHESAGEDDAPDTTAEQMIRQPESSPISADQLATEVKGIYAGLVMVEAKCINIDAAQAAEVNSPLTQEQWQALIALHRTLLYEHHDFLMATQHPTATEALKGLALKYSMPARMWKHGIHAFLEVLRHRRPESQEYMLAFIYLAYQMMALLFETVPSFTDTWIECLGDLARYRMAIEEDKEVHATWGGVAARWYTMASDRNTTVGRLYHHLGILERPSLRKLCFYSKSLTCAIPFTNARDSLRTLCGPIVQDVKTIESYNQSVEALIVTYYALEYMRKEKPTVEKVRNDALRLLSQQLHRLRELGANLAISSISSLFDLGSPANPLWRMFTEANEMTANAERPARGMEMDIDLPALAPPASVSPSLHLSADFCYTTFNMVLKPWSNKGPWKEHLPFVHILLVWQYSLFSLPNRSSVAHDSDTYRTLMDPARVNWGGLSEFLNSLTRHHPIKPAIMASAIDRRFPRIPTKVKNEKTGDSSDTKFARPLGEDYLLRGLVWTPTYFDADHFASQAEDDGRAIETESMRADRADRILWLSLILAIHAQYLTYDGNTGIFSAPAHMAATPEEDKRPLNMMAISAVLDSPGIPVGHLSSCPSRSSRRTSVTASSDEGFVVVTNAKPRRNPETGARRGSIARPPATAPAPPPAAPKAPAPTKKRASKPRPDLNAFRVLDTDNDIDMAELEYSDHSHHHHHHGEYVE